MEKNKQKFGNLLFVLLLSMGLLTTSCLGLRKNKCNECPEWTQKSKQDKQELLTVEHQNNFTTYCEEIPVDSANKTQ